MHTGNRSYVYRILLIIILIHSVNYLMDHTVVKMITTYGMYLATTATVIIHAFPSSHAELGKTYKMHAHRRT